jgi:hypothetical protein
MPRGVDLNRFKTSWDGETIKILDVGMSFAEGGKVSDKAQLEMELIMNEQVDPVSGNTAPIGAKPEEVRDDVEIRVSPGEYVINAQTVRYFGEGFFDELQKSAAEGFERIKEGEELPFRDDELDIEDDETEEVEPEGFAYGGRVKGYAEGDLVVPEPVGGGYGQYGGTGAMFTGYQSKTFINDETGQKKIFFFFNGRPLSRIPAGFREMGETPVEEKQKAEEVILEKKEDRRELGYELKTSYNEKDVKEWSDYDYGQNYKDMLDIIESGKDIRDLTLAEQAVLGVVGTGITGSPLGGLALSRLAKNSKRDRAVEIFNQTQGLINKGEFSDPIFEKTVRYTNYMIGKQLGFLDEDAVEPEKPDVSLLSRYAGKDKPTSGLDFNPSTSVFETQYDRDEALSGTFGSKAAYLASQEIHSQGLRAKGLPDTSYFGTNQDLVTTVKNLATYGTVHTPEQAAAVSTPEPTPAPAPVVKPAPAPVVKKDDGKKAHKAAHKAFVEKQQKMSEAKSKVEKAAKKDPSAGIYTGGGRSGGFNKGGLIERPNR